MRSNKQERDAWRKQLKEINSRWTRRGDRRSIETVEKGKATALRNRRKRARARGNARRAAQSAELGARRFRRELSATAVVLKAIEPGRWYLRSDIRAACPELPGGALRALLGLSYPALLERAPNPAWDGKRGSRRPKGADTSPERRSKWRWRLTFLRHFQLGNCACAAS